MIFMIRNWNTFETVTGAHMKLRRGATNKVFGFPISCFPVCNTTKRISFGWVQGGRNNEVISVWSSGGMCKVNTFFFFNSVACFFIKPKASQLPRILKQHGTS
jgi:hypothetical protein